MVECQRCGKKPSAANLGHMGDICRGCFIVVIEHRVRKHLRQGSPLKKGQKILLLTDNSMKSVVAECILESITKPMPLTDVEKRHLGSDISGFDHVFYPISANDIANGFLKGIFSKESVDKKKSVVGCLLDSEIKVYADLKDLKYETSEKDDFAKKMEELEGYYPGSTFGLVKTKDKLQ
ncbi:MAG: hypothetical protein ACE5FT_02955 [Candidatus Nanoarchaeia archaeon]